MEEFRDVIGYEEYFKVSNLGNIYSKRSNRLLKQTKNKSGYLCISTRIGGRNGHCVCLRVHRLVAEAFLDKPTVEQLNWASHTKYGKVLVNHKDGDKTNNKAHNLEWATASENTNHAISTGLLTYKERNTEHGTYTNYRYGCRCQSCKDAYSKVRRERYLRLGT